MSPLAPINVLNYTQNKTRQKSEKGYLPDVLREAKFDEFFILVLIKTHKDGVVTGFRSSLEVEHHFSLLQLDRKKRALSLLRVFEALIDSTSFPDSDAAGGYTL